jgi:hypothetical protein
MKGIPEQCCDDRPARIRQPGKKDCKSRTARTGQTARDSQNRTAEKDIEKRLS